MGKLKVILSTTAGGGSVAGVQSVTGEGVGGTAENVVMSFPDQSEVQAIRPLKTVNNESLEGTGNITIEAGGAVNSVTGDGVGGTAEDVVLTFPNADEVDDSSTTNKFLTQTEKDVISSNTDSITDLQTNKADQSDLDDLDGRVTQNEADISSNNLPLEEVDGDKGVKYTTGAITNIDWGVDDDSIPSIGMIKSNVSSDNIYNTDGTLTSDRTISGDSKNLSIGTADSPIGFKSEYTSNGVLNLNISDGSFTGDFPEWHNVGDGDNPVLGFYAKRKVDASLNTGQDMIVFDAGSATDDNWFGFYDYQKSNGAIKFFATIKPDGQEPYGKIYSYINSGGGDVTNGEDFKILSTKFDTIDPSNQIIRSVFEYNRTYGFSFDDRELGLGVRYAAENSYANIDWATNDNHIPSIDLVKKNAQKYLPLEIVSDGSTLTISTSNAFTAIHMDDNTSTVNTIEIGQDCLEIGQDIEVHVGGNSVGFDFVNLDSSNVSIVGSLASGSTTAWDTVGLRRMSDGAFGQTGKQVYKTV